MEMFFVSGIGIAVLIEFLLISKKNKSESDNILTLWMFLVLLHLFFFYLFFTGEIFRFSMLLGIESPFPLLHGVFLFLYASSLTDRMPRRRIWIALHFVPAAAVYVYLIDFFTLPDEQKISLYQNQGAGYELFISIRYIAVIFSGIFYVAWTAILLHRHRRTIRDQFSDLEKVSLQWLWFLTIGLGGLWFMVIVFQNDVLLFSGVVIFIFLIGFFGIRQSNIFIHNETPEEETDQRKKYTKSGLTEDQSRALHQSLLELMEKEALYRKSELSIGDISTRLGIHPNYLSQVINEIEGKNFYDFVNTYRVEEFKKLIAIPKNQQVTLLSLAFDCGFNSKSSFNRFFKKATGKTPSEYFTAILEEKRPAP